MVVTHALGVRPGQTEAIDTGTTTIGVNATLGASTQAVDTSRAWNHAIAVSTAGEAVEARRSPTLLAVMTVGLVGAGERELVDAGAAFTHVARSTFGISFAALVEATSAVIITEERLGAVSVLSTDQVLVELAVTIDTELATGTVRVRCTTLFVRNALLVLASEAIGAVVVAITFWAAVSAMPVAAVRPSTAITIDLTVHADVFTALVDAPRPILASLVLEAAVGAAFTSVGDASLSLWAVAIVVALDAILTDVVDAHPAVGAV